MKALDFYKFITENNIEFHWSYNDLSRERDVVFFPAIHQLKELNDMLTSAYFDDSRIPCVMKQGYFAFWFNDVTMGDIDPVEIFGADPNPEKE